MKTYQSRRAPLLCAQWREGDGVMPRFEQHSPVKRQASKDRQLSKQAQRALSLFLEGECRHPDLLGVQVIAVEYEPAKQRLCVGVRSSSDAGGEAILTALKHSQAPLRSVVAASLHRKKVPVLGFYYEGNSNKGGESCRFEA